jgi:hypothetical protein
MSSGAGNKPRCLINQSRALISRLGTRQTINKARVADNRAIATAQIVPFSLDKIGGFPFRVVVSTRPISKKNARFATEAQRHREKERQRDRRDGGTEGNCDPISLFLYPSIPLSLYPSVSMSLCLCG